MAYKTIIVDDDRFETQLIQSILNNSELDFECRCADNVMALLNIITSEYFDIILLDYHLPIAEAPEIIEKLKKIYINTPNIILVTCDRNESVIKDIEKLGISSIVYKDVPIHIFENNLLLAVKQILKLQVEELDHNDHLPTSYFNSASNQQSSIIVADNSDMIREMFSSFIKNMGGQAISCDNASEIFSVLEQDNKTVIDLLIIGSELSDLSGLETLRKIRKTPGINTLPILFISSNKDEAFMEQVIIAGADDYLIKPVPYILLRTKVLTQMNINQMRRKIQNP